MKTTEDRSVYGRWCCIGAVGCCLILASACSALNPGGSLPPPSFYVLDSTRNPEPTAFRIPPVSAPSLVISVPRAAAGFDSRRIMYLRQPHKLEHFLHSEWIDTPARMLSPLMIAAVENRQVFQAVVHAPSSASGALRLDTEILRLQHEFSSQPSQVRFALRASLVEDATRNVIATHTFEATAPAASDDPYGGVLAANEAVRSVLEQLAAFCAEAVKNWQAKD